MLAILFVSLFILIAKYRVYQKTGILGWKSLIPICSTWTMIKTLYGSGWIIFVPVYGQFVLLITRHFRLAKRFGLPKSFGFGLWLLNPVFMVVLAYSDAQYKDGALKINNADLFSRLGDKIDAWAKGRAKAGGSKNAIAALKALNAQFTNGQIDEETFKTKKAELLKQI